METRANYKILFAMALMYFVSIYISDTLPGGQLLTLIPAVVMLLVAIQQNKGKIQFRAGGYFLYIIVFLAFCVLSRLWAQDPNLAVTKINALIFILLAMIAVGVSIYGMQDIDFFLKTIMYGGYIVCIYMFVRYGWGGIARLIVNSTRMDNELLNANSLGMCAAYAIVIDMHYAIYDRWKPHNVLMIPALIVLAASGSRKAIVILVIGVFGVYVLKNTNNKKILKNIGRFLLILVVAIGLIFLLSRLPFFTTIRQRMLNLISLLMGNETRRSSDAWIRLAYVRLGMQLFREHPILGIGIANANIYTSAYYGHNHYLHNNYVELLACGGSVGFLIYYSVWAWLLSTFIKCRRQRSREYDICLILLLIHLVMDYGAVSYYSKLTYYMLLLFWMEARKLLQERNNGFMESVVTSSSPLRGIHDVQ